MKNKTLRKFSGLIALLTIALLVGAFTQIHASDLVGICAAGLPFLGGAVFLDKDTGGKFGAAITKAMADAGDDTDAQLKAGMKAVGTTVDQFELQQKEIVGNLQGDVKKAMEAVEMAQKHGADLGEKILVITKLQKAISQEQRSSFGSPIQRITDSPDKSARIIASVCRAVGRDVPQSVAKLLGEDSSPGSTLIDDELSRDIYDSLLSYGAFRTLGIMPVGTKQTKLPVTTARPAAGFVLTEGGTISTDSAKAGTTVTLEVEVIAAIVPVALQLLEDSPLDVAGNLVAELVEACAFVLDYACFRGDGTSDATNGGITGLLNFATEQVAATTHTTVATTTYVDWLKCLTGVDAAVIQRPGARWWMHPTQIANALGVQGADGRPIFLTALEAPSLGALGSILGFPITPVGAMPATNAAGAKIAAFGDPRAFAVGVRRDISIETSDHAGWSTFTRSFRAITRAGAVGRKASALTYLKTAAA